MNKNQIKIVVRALANLAALHARYARQYTMPEYRESALAASKSYVESAKLVWLNSKICGL